ncbi:MAG TPA: phage tail protein [Solirubrobacteraceae bacterium]|jgi:phage tail-like protein|nr:phage tail protein [Solirubrobacteraceae bacterium]
MADDDGTSTDQPADGARNGGGVASSPTFAGVGFGTIQLRRVVGEDPPPQPASARAHLRESLPAVYREGDFGMRFVGALEHVLDPIVALLDNLPAHFDPRHSPPDIVELLGAWLGLEHDEARRGEDRRELVLGAAELLRRRGTRAGLEQALALAFPGVPFRVEDGGGVTWSTARGEPGDGASRSDAASFVVYCERSVPEATQAAIARLIERSKPAHTAFRLRVKAPKARPKEEGP